MVKRNKARGMVQEGRDRNRKVEKEKASKTGDRKKEGKARRMQERKVMEGRDRKGRNR